MTYALKILLLFLLPFHLCGQNQEVKTFDIKLAGVKIGELKATKRSSDTLTYYTLDSKVSFWFFVTVNVHHQNKTVYHKQKLISSVSTSASNKGNFTSSIVWDKDQYRVKVSSYKYENVSPIKEAIDCNVVRVYFEEPANVRKMLADGYGVMAPITKVKTDAYDVEVLGNRNKYFYSKGKLVRASMYSKFKNYEVVLKSE